MFSIEPRPGRNPELFFLPGYKQRSVYERRLFNDHRLGRITGIRQGGHRRRYGRPLIGTLSLFALLMVSCSPTPASTEAQKVRVAPVRRSLGTEIIRSQGRVIEIRGGIYQIRIPWPCEASRARKARYTIISPTLDRSRISATPDDAANSVADTETLTLVFRFESGLLDQLQVPVEVSGCAGDRWTVPVEAIRAPTGRVAYLYKVEKNKALRVGPVQIIQIAGSLAEVEGPVTEAERIIVEGLELVSHGDSVEVVP